MSLPTGRHSHGLARLAVLEAVRGSLDAAKATIENRCGTVIGKRQLAHLVQQSTVDIDAFYQQQTPMPCTSSTLLVLSMDGKGIVMRPEALRRATAKAAARPPARSGPGWRPGRSPAASGWPPSAWSTTPTPRHVGRTT
ncbi:MAG: hypothetical protein JWN00_1554 [Actinomycetia bacterium]|nr:hypothetical protein [Actinomycetes bacterium]